MTLIFSKIDNEIGLFTGSDILVSAPAKYGVPALELPFREQPLAFESQDYALRGVSQKTVLFGRTVVQWADSLEVSRAVINRLFQMSNRGQRCVDLKEALRSAGVNDSEIARTSLIYHFAHEDGTIIREWHNCSWVTDGGSVIGEGSGAWQFLEDHAATGGEHPNQSFVGLVAKVVSHAVYEATSIRTLEYLYGGWFELALVGLAAQPRKIAYAVKFWSKGDGKLGSGGPMFFGFYVGAHLMIVRLQPREVAGKVSHEQMMLRVPDLLRREHGSDEEVVYRPEMIAHVVIDSDSGGRVMTWVEGEPEIEKEMVLEVSRRGSHIEYTPSLRQRLLALAPSDKDVKVSHQHSLEG